MQTAYNLLADIRGAASRSRYPTPAARGAKAAKKGLELLMAAGLAAASSAGQTGELPLRAASSPMAPKPDRTQCKDDPTSAMQQALVPVDERLKVWSDAKSEFQQLKQSILAQKALDFGLLGSFGPSAHTMEAKKLGQIATATRFIANSTRRFIDIMAPISTVDMSLGAARLGVKAYAALVNGEKLVDAFRDPAKSLASTLAKEYFGEPAEIAEAVFESTQEFRAIGQNAEDYGVYAEEVKAQLVRLDSSIAWADQKIEQEHLRLRRELNEDFARFCAENEKPLARDDQVQTQSGVPTVIDVLRNDHDPDGKVVVLVSVAHSRTTRGTIEVTKHEGRSVIRYTAPKEFLGVDRFQYEIADELGAKAKAEVIVRVGKKDEKTKESPYAVDSPYAEPPYSNHVDNKDKNLGSNDFKYCGEVYDHRNLKQASTAQLLAAATGGGVIPSRTVCWDLKQWNRYTHGVNEAMKPRYRDRVRTEFVNCRIRRGQTKPTCDERQVTYVEEFFE